MQRALLLEYFWSEWLSVGDWQARCPSWDADVRRALNHGFTPHLISVPRHERYSCDRPFRIIELGPLLSHEDVTKWEWFSHYWFFVRSFVALLVVSLNRLSNKQSGSWWLETSYRPCGIIAMKRGLSFRDYQLERGRRWVKLSTAISSLRK